MYEKLYDENAYAVEFLSDVMSCKEVTWENEDVYEFVLEKTSFFPEQGGQTSDTGMFYDTDSENEFEVFHAYIKDDTVYHLARLAEKPAVETRRKKKAEEEEEPKKIEINPPKRIIGRINWDERFDKMQQHSGEHLVSGTVHRLYGYDNVGFSLSSDNVTLDFNGKFSDEEILEIEKTVNRAVFENFKVKVYFPSEEELKKIDYRSKKELTGRIRLVEFPGYDICACCAPHVASTGEIGLIKIVSAEHFKGGTRMSIKCGYRALNEYRTLLDSVRGISRLLSVTLDEVLPATEKLKTDLQDSRFQLNGYKEKVLCDAFENAIESADRDHNNPIMFTDLLDPAIIRKAINNVTDRTNGYCGVFYKSEKEGYSFIIGSIAKDCKVLFDALKEAFETKGGGNKTMIQGNVVADEVQIKELLKEYSCGVFL
ncbi:MAG: alanyl-tRNA editing protein [Lachnospiraceae bacterium]|nr:alanyl-tRNA editing protein [Lachnospiraceae bacterium]